jgi:hypothetical protein
MSEGQFGVPKPWLLWRETSPFGTQTSTMGRRKGSKNNSKHHDAGGKREGAGRPKTKKDAEPTGKFLHIIVYLFIVNLLLISPYYSISPFLGVATFLAVGNSSFCNGRGFGCGETPMTSDGSCSTIYPAINPHRVSGQNIVSFSGLFGVLWGHGCPDPSSFFLHSNYPILTHSCLSVLSQNLQNIRV